MFVILFCFLVTSFIFIVLGKSFVLKFDFLQYENYSIFDYFFIGLCFAGTLLNIWSLFFATNIFSLIFLLFISLLFFYYNKKKIKDIYYRIYHLFKSEKLFFLIFIISLFVVLFFSLITPRNYDSYLYHINSIQWNETYRVVPGLANFHDRFGFNSSILVLSATFSFNAIYNQYIFIISSLCFFVFFVWLTKRIYFQKGFTGIFCLFFLYFFSQQYYLDISSPGTDLLPNILVSFLLLSIIFDDKSLQKKYLLFAVTSIFCLSLKLSVFPIAIIGVIAIYLKTNKIGITIKQTFFFFSFFIIPWLIRNIIITGYIIYPMEKLDFFNFDWKIPVERVIETKNWVYSWARIPMRDYHEVLKMNFKEWFSIWWEVLIPKNQRLFILASLAPLTFIIYFLFNKKNKNLSVFIAISTAYISFVLWMLTAPDIRFSFSFLLFLALFPLFIFKKLLVKFNKLYNPLLIILLFYNLFIFGKSGYKLFCEEYNSIKYVSEYIYLPKDVYYVKENRNIQFLTKDYFTPNNNKIKLFGPKIINTQCFDKFPCAPLLDTRFNLRGESLQDGFKN